MLITEKSKQKIPYSKVIRIIMLIVAVCLNIKYVFVDFGIDAGFQTTMAYRLVDGDSMFKAMWEPYQMSAFLCAFFEMIYLKIFHTTTGIVLYLQIMGVLLDVLVAVCIYIVVSRFLSNEKVAFVMAWVVMIVSPKDVPLAEYSNMQVWLSMLLVLTLYLYYRLEQKRWIVLAAFCLCGAVLSYPSCVILLFGVIFLLWYYRDWKGIVIVISLCIGIATLYLGLIFRHISFGDFISSIQHILALETSHSVSMIDKLADYCKQALILGAIYVLAYGIAYSVTILRYKNEYRSWNRTKMRVRTDKVFFVIILLVSAYSVFDWQKNVRYSYSLIFVGIMIMGFRHCKVLSKDKFYFYLCGTTIAILQFLATLLLTNLVLIASVPYLLIGVLVGFLPLSEVIFSEEEILEQKKSMKRLLLLSALFLVFRNGYLIRPMNGDVSTICDIAGIVKGGPAIGIVSEYMGPYMQNETIKEWEQYIKEGDSVYLIGGSLDTLAYLYADTVIAAPSLVPTPGYNESILAYWEMNPEKYPDVIVASCWYGTMNEELTQDSWIMKWIEEEYQPVYYVDGKYWRYYFRE